LINASPPKKPAAAAPPAINGAFARRAAVVRAIPAALVPLTAASPAAATFARGSVGTGACLTAPAADFPAREADLVAEEPERVRPDVDFAFGRELFFRFEACLV
jgi:hypothetical protein